MPQVDVPGDLYSTIVNNDPQVPAAVDYDFTVSSF